MLKYSSLTIHYHIHVSVTSYDYGRGAICTEPLRFLTTLTPEPLRMALQVQLPY